MPGGSLYGATARRGAIKTEQWSCNKTWFIIKRAPLFRVFFFPLRSSSSFYWSLNLTPQPIYLKTGTNDANVRHRVEWSAVLPTLHPSNQDHLCESIGILCSRGNFIGKNHPLYHPPTAIHLKQAARVWGERRRRVERKTCGKQVSVFLAPLARTRFWAQNCKQLKFSSSRPSLCEFYCSCVARRKVLELFSMIQMPIFWFFY